MNVPLVRNGWPSNVVADQCTKNFVFIIYCLLWLADFTDY